MLKNFRDKIALSGVTVLIVGVVLLIFTFVSAYGFLTQSLSIISSEDMVRTFGEALAPLIATCIRIMYLGVMGWVGSLLTIRGVTIISHAPPAPQVVPQKETAIAPKPLPKPQPQPQPHPQSQPLKPKAEKPKEMEKPPEPEIIVIPPEPASPPQIEQKTEQKEEQKNESPQQSQPQTSN